MEAAEIVQLVTAFAALTAQLTPLAEQIAAAVQSGDGASATALLAKIQAVNDQLGAAL